MNDVVEKPLISERTDVSMDFAYPPQFAVVFHNDDHTPVDFVISLIVSVFGKAYEEAAALTMKVHENGSAVIDLYDYEIAEQKKIECDEASRKFGFPLKVTIEEQE